MGPKTARRPAPNLQRGKRGNAGLSSQRHRERTGVRKSELNKTLRFVLARCVMYVFAGSQEGSEIS